MSIPCLIAGAVALSLVNPPWNESAAGLTTAWCAPAVQDADPPDTPPDDPSAPDEPAAGDDPAAPPGEPGDPSAVPGSPPAPGQPAPPATTPAPDPVRIAVFPLDVTKGLEVDAAGVTDQVSVMLASQPDVTIVNREQLERIAEEQQMALTGLVDTATAVKLGRFVNAQHILVGRLSRIDETYYLVLKLVDVETTVQQVISSKAGAVVGVNAVLERLEPKLGRALETVRAGSDAAPSPQVPEALRRAAAGLADKVVVVHVSEEHVSRPLRDPAAQMAVAHRLESLGMDVIIMEDPPTGWKRQLQRTGRYMDEAVDFLLEGDGTSAFAAEVQNLVSCRARVELRLVPLPGRRAIVTEKGVAAGVDLVEAIAAKAALEEAAVQAVDGLIMRRWELEQEGAQEPRSEGAEG